MLKKNVIIFSILAIFSILNIGPYYLISCTETNGNNHLENVFNRCCKSPMHTMHHQPAGQNESAYTGSHCKCSVNISIIDYIITHTEKSLVNQATIIYCTEIQGKTIKERNFLRYKSESPPISIHMVKTAVFLI